VRQALATLPNDQQQAVEMAFFSGLTQQEIAANLHQPLGTVKARIRRGLLKLRDVLVGKNPQ
jgi:RNA polymerase sigma-70 factor (ECF subfamily)